MIKDDDMIIMMINVFCELNNKNWKKAHICQTQKIDFLRPWKIVIDTYLHSSHTYLVHMSSVSGKQVEVELPFAVRSNSSKLKL